VNEKAQNPTCQIQCFKLQAFDLVHGDGRWAHDEECCMFDTNEKHELKISTLLKKYESPSEIN
jgi:hypothetical protein